MEKKHTISTDSFSMPVKKITLPNPLIVEPDYPISNCIDVMQDLQASCLLVVENDQLKGIVTEKDFLTKIVGNYNDLSSINISQIMTHSPNYIIEDDPIHLALHFFYQEDYRHLPVLDKNKKPIKVLKIKDLFNFLCGELPRELLEINDEDEDDLPEY